MKKWSKFVFQISIISFFAAISGDPFFSVPVIFRCRRVWPKEPLSAQSLPIFVLYFDVLLLERKEGDTVLSRASLQQIRSYTLWSFFLSNTGHRSYSPPDSGLLIIYTLQQRESNALSVQPPLRNIAVSLYLLNLHFEKLVVLSVYLNLFNYWKIFRLQYSSESASEPP
jgi:hypothetical protein